MYKYCIVPKCTSTSFKTPEKLFFSVPKDPKLRIKWFFSAKRNDYSTLSKKTTRYCCEDHFDVEEDMDNYIKFKLVGGQLKLKKGVLPHKFDCIKPPKKKIERNAFKKRQQIEHFRRVLSANIEHEDLLMRPIEVVECVPEKPNVPCDPLEIPAETVVNPKMVKKSRSVQVNMKPKVRSKSTNTPIEWQQPIVVKCEKLRTKR